MGTGVSHLPPPSLFLPFAEGGRAYLFNTSTLALAEVAPDLADLVTRARRTGWTTAFASEDTRARERVAEALTAFSGNAAPPPARQPVQPDEPIEEAYLVLTNSCNLRCHYCFDTGTSRRDAMSSSTLAHAVEFLTRRASPAKGLRLILWGGEPLLYPDLVEEALEAFPRACARRGIPLAVGTTTNGTRLTERMADLLAVHHVSVNVILDGDQSANRHRVGADGGSIYRSAIEGISRLLSAQARHASRGCVTARMTVNHDTVRSFARGHFALWNEGIPIVWAKDVDWLPPGHRLSLTEPDLAALEHEYECLRDNICDQIDAGDGDRIGAQLRFDLTRLHRRGRHLHACGAGRTTLSIMPDGTVTPCYHLQSYGPRYRVGNVHREDESLGRSNDLCAAGAFRI